MNHALNLIGFKGLVGTGSGSQTATAAKAGRGSAPVDFASLLQSKVQRNTGKGRSSEPTTATSTRTDQAAETAGMVLKAVKGDPAATSDETAARGSGPQAVDTRDVGEKPAETGVRLEVESEPEPDNGLALDSDPELKELLTLLSQLMAMLENQASPDGGTDEAANTGAGGINRSGQNDLRQLLANLIAGEAVNGDSADPTAETAISQLKEFAKLLESIQTMIAGDNGVSKAASQAAAGQTNLTTQPGVAAGTGVKPPPTVSTLIERLEEALQRWEARDQGDGTQTASKAVNRGQAQKVENLVRGILQMVKAAEVVNRNVAPEPAAPTVTDSPVKTDAAVANPMPTAANSEPESGGETANQPATRQNGAPKDTALESKAAKMAAQDESAEPPEQVTKATSQVQEQKPAAVVLNQGGGQLEQRLNDTTLTLQRDAETGSQPVMKPIIEGMRLVQRESRTEMSIQLQPESLGKLNLKVSVENGLVTAKLVAESHSVGRLIESSLGQLKQSLQEQGLRFDRIEVSVGNTSAQADTGQQFSRQYQSQSWGNQAPRVSYSGGIDSDWTYQPAESAGAITGYISDSQYDFLA